MTELPTLDQTSAVARPREGGARLVVEVLVWVIAFSLLLCVPTDRPGGAKSAPGAALTGETAR